VGENTDFNALIDEVRRMKRRAERLDMARLEAEARYAKLLAQLESDVFCALHRAPASKLRFGKVTETVVVVPADMTIRQLPPEEESKRQPHRRCRTCDETGHDSRNCTAMAVGT
jgi:hypothetical protein